MCGPLKLDAKKLRDILWTGAGKKEPGQLTQREAAKFVIQLTQQIRVEVHREREHAKPTTSQPRSSTQSVLNGAANYKSPNGSPH